MSKYYKNFILCGEVDFYCLLCKESFEIIDEVEKHIRWEQHRKLIKNQEYFPKLKKDCVYKVLDKYYCEYCNYVAPTLEKVKSHIKEEEHKTKKSNTTTADVKKESLVKREFDFVVVSKMVMNKKEWHGVVDNQCVFCNTAVSKFNEHVALPDHMISLIQAHIKTEEDGQVYRKINEDTYYCLKCKQTFFIDFLDIHCSSDKHTGKQQENGKSKELYKLDRENCVATCTVCNKSMISGWLTMHTHKEEHIKKNEWIKDDKKFVDRVDKGKARSDLKRFGKENFIKMNEGGSKGYCTLCNTNISAHMINFRQHVNGVRHNSFLELKGLVKTTKKTEKPRYKTKPLSHFMKDILNVKRTFLVPSVELCIDVMSFGLFTPVDRTKSNQFFCFVCDGVYQDMKAHLNTDHHSKLFQAEVITTLKNEAGGGEFVRVIRPGLYHCGVCNMAVAGWSVLEKHLNLLKHKMAWLEAHKMIEEVIDPDLIGCQSNGFDYSQINNFVLD